MFENKEQLDFILRSKAQALDLVLITVIRSSGSSFAKLGNSMFVNSKAEFAGVLGTSILHAKLMQHSLEVLTQKSSFCFKTTPATNSIGHGEVEYLIQAFFYKENYGALGVALENFGKTLIRSTKDNSFSLSDTEDQLQLEDKKFYQPIKKPYSLLIFGASVHITSLISMANLMGWETTIIDVAIQEEFVKEADHLISLNKADDINTKDLNLYDASVILSHNSQTDITYLKALLQSSIEYIGMMGNKKSMQHIKNTLQLENEKRFFAPIGLDIGKGSYQTVALSICAQIEAKKNNNL